MKYISTVEAAEKWSISSRQVQRLLAAGRIEGAKKYHRSWMIPAGAAKPEDRRCANEPRQSSLAADLAYLIPKVYVSADRDDPGRVVAGQSEKRLRLIHEGALAYVRGDFLHTIRCYKQNEGDDGAKLCSASIAIAAAISTGSYTFYAEVESFLRNVVRANISAEVSAVAELALSTAYLGAMAPNMIPGWLKKGDFSALPPQVKPDAAYKHAKYFQCIGDYASMLAVARTALSFCDTPHKMSFPGTYLRMMCAVACSATDRGEEARRWLLEAMRINLPHGYITPFAELIPLFGSLMEQLLEQEFPAHYAAVIKQCKRTFTNWLMFHNQFAKDNITLILSLRDYEMARLAVRGVPYAKIAEHFHISVGRVNNIMREIREKLFVSNRTELAKFIL